MARTAGKVLNVWRRLARRLRPSRPTAHTPLFYNKLYGMELPGSLIDPDRSLKILTFLEVAGLLPRGGVQRARRVDLALLRRVHTDVYLESLQSREAMTAILGCQLTDELQDRFLVTSRAMVGGTVRAARHALLHGGIAVNLGGGFHHAEAERGTGFCVFNDVAIAVAACRQDGWAGHALVIDLDLHDGQGTRAIFAEDRAVHTFSIHNHDLPPLPALSSTSVALGDEIDDDTYLHCLRERLPPVLQEARPDLVFYVAGADVALGDKRGTWRLSGEGLLARDRFVLEQVRRQRKDLPLVIVLGGGYGMDAWRFSARSLAWLLSGRTTFEAPLNLELPLERYRHGFYRLSEADLVAEPAEQSWSLSESDLYALGRPQQTRFLDTYSRYGLELVLERSGLLDRIRAKGYENLRMDWDLDDPAGQTVRILTVDDGQQVLGELRVRRDRRTVSGMELLAVEWLLLQDPRANFAADRPPLPGQKHPGLGLLRDFAAVLVLICERLGLDGLSFVPAHFTMAAETKRLVRFLDPVAEARFQAVGKALRGLRMREAITAVETGRLRDRRTGSPLIWEPVPMVLPVSRRLKDIFDSEPYRRRLQDAAGQFSFDLLPTGET